MKNTGLLLLAALTALAVVVLTILTKLIGGAFRFVLGTLIVLALIVLVIWMFAYAKRRR